MRTFPAVMLMLVCGAAFAWLPDTSSFNADKTPPYSWFIVHYAPDVLQWYCEEASPEGKQVLHDMLVDGEVVKGITVECSGE